MGEGVSTSDIKKKVFLLLGGTGNSVMVPIATAFAISSRYILSCFHNIIADEITNKRYYKNLQLEFDIDSYYPVSLCNLEDEKGDWVILTTSTDLDCTPLQLLPFHLFPDLGDDTNNASIIMCISFSYSVGLLFTDNCYQSHARSGKYSGL